MRTDSPTWDAECYYQSQIDTRPFIGNCCECDRELHGREYGGDEDIIYLMENGNLVCARCKTNMIENADWDERDGKVYLYILGKWVPEDEAEDLFEQQYRL